MPAGVVKQLWQELKQQGSSLTPAARSEQEYHFFCSFDLVNSTALKARERSWPVIIGSFSDFVIDAISKREKDLVPWKFAGDEVVFTQRVYRLGDLHRLVPRVYDALLFVIDRIYQHFEVSRGLVSVRATAWGAFCLNGAGDLNQTIQEIAGQPYRNIRIERRKGTEANPLVELDFMGPSIDEGFRLQKVAPKGRLAISAELAFFLSQGGGAARVARQALKIVGFEKLKGRLLVQVDRRFGDLLRLVLSSLSYREQKIPAVRKLALGFLGQAIARFSPKYLMWLETAVNLCGTMVLAPPEKIKDVWLDPSEGYGSKRSRIGYQILLWPGIAVLVPKTRRAFRLVEFAEAEVGVGRLLREEPRTIRKRFLLMGSWEGLEWWRDCSPGLQQNRRAMSAMEVCALVAAEVAVAKEAREAAVWYLQNAKALNERGKDVLTKALRGHSGLFEDIRAVLIALE